MALVTEDDVIAFLELQHTTPQTLAGLTGAVAAANDLVSSWKGAGWDSVPRFRQGAVMLAARLYRRRFSPGGLEGYSSGDGGLAYVQRNDPDIAQLLGLGIYKRPQVG